MASPVVVLGDLHLTRRTPAAVSDALARVFARHRGAKIVFDGDLFDLSAETERRRDSARERIRAAIDILGALPSVRSTMAEHLGRDGELVLVAGNHDADVGEPGFREAFADALDLSNAARARLFTTPWFHRDGALHLEHGHQFDPDNAHEHPLVVGEPSLGVHFVESFIAKAGAYRFLDANDDTPLKLLMNSFYWYGPRAPYVVYRYFHTAVTALARSGPLYRAASERQRGDARLADFAEAAGVDVALVSELIGLGARPTLESLRSTFSRLYLDRVAATFAMAGGLGALAAGNARAGLRLAAIGAFAMGASWSVGHDRYGGTVAERLAAGARAVAGATGAKLVVFGHTHREALEPGYANTASFSFPRGGAQRPYLVVEGLPDAPRPVRMYG